MKQLQILSAGQERPLDLLSCSWAGAAVAEDGVGPWLLCFGTWYTVHCDVAFFLWPPALCFPARLLCPCCCLCWSRRRLSLELDRRWGEEICFPTRIFFNWLLSVLPSISLLGVALVVRITGAEAADWSEPYVLGLSSRCGSRFRQVRTLSHNQLISSSVGVRSRRIPFWSYTGSFPMVLLLGGSVASIAAVLILFPPWEEGGAETWPGLELWLLVLFCGDVAWFMREDSVMRVAFVLGGRPLFGRSICPRVIGALTTLGPLEAGSVLVTAGTLADTGRGGFWLNFLFCSKKMTQH